MIIFKVLGFATLVAGFGFIGILKSRSLKNSCLILKDLIRAVSIIQAELSLHVTPVYACCRLAAQQVGGPVGVLFSSCQNFSQLRPFDEQWTELILQADLVQDIKEILVLLGDFFGKYDLESQLSDLDMLRKRLESCREDMMLQYQKFAPLYRNLGIGFGLLIGIILL